MDGYLIGINAAVVGGAGLVLPAAMPAAARTWRAVAVVSVVALAVAPSPLAAVLALCWPAAGLWHLVGTSRAQLAAWRVDRSVRLDRVLTTVATLAVPAWATVAGLALVDSCRGDHWLGFGEPILRLTAVHFTFAGVGATSLALWALMAGGTVVRRLGVVLVVIGPVVTGLGFTTGSDAAEVGGPVVMALGVYLVAAAMVADGWNRRIRVDGWLLMVAGVAAIVPMVLAVAWALAPHTGGPSLSIPDMVRVHGGVQALGFIGCGMLGRRVLPILSIGGLTPTQAERLLVDGQLAEPTSGALLVGPHTGPTPDAFVLSRGVGRGADDFEAAAEALRSLVPQRSVAQVLPNTADASEGATILVVIGFGPVSLVAVNRVVWVIDEPGHWGFAYGTLPGHPERGQESFEVTMDPEGQVVVTITGRGVVAVPGGGLLRPILRPLQERFAERYLDAVSAAVLDRRLVAGAAR